MKKHGKKYRAAAEKIDHAHKYTLDEAVKKLKEIAFAKFDETVELTVWLGVDPRKADQMIRGTVSLPHGTGKSVRVAAFATGDKGREAQEAGADVVGGEATLEEARATLEAAGWVQFIREPDLVLHALGRRQDTAPAASGG